MRFLLRDDDTSALTRPEELEACYAAYWDRVPVNLSVTPFRVPGEFLGVPPDRYGETQPLPLHLNRDLVDALRRWLEARRIHVAMHGYHHCRVDGQPEFVGGCDLERKVREGRHYLEDLLGVRISTFVPPNNSLGPEGLAAVVRNRLNLVWTCPSDTITTRLRSPGGALDAALSVAYRGLNRLGRPSRHHVRSYRLHKEASYHTVGPSQRLADVRTSLHSCPRRGGVFILATHYHAFARPMQSGESVGTAVASILDEVLLLPGVRFCTYDDLW